MTEFNHPEQAIKQFRFRLFLAGLFVVLLFLVLVARLLWLQVISYDKYQSKAEDNRITIVPLVPNRGLILDRNGVVLANNYSAYTLEITPSKIDNLNEMIDELGKIVEISALDRRRFKKLRAESKRFESIPIRTRLTDEEVARFAVQSFRFPGVEIRARLFRQYPYGPHAAHLLGYIGRISARDQERIEELDQTNNYRGTAYIGKDGLEKRYETQLHGRTGFEEVETSAGGRAVRVLSRSPAVPGENLMLSIDIRLQEAAEKALDGKRGALVAIDPRNGDILAMVSAPSFDPNLFVEGIDSENWKLLNESIDRPLLNRPLAGTYPPGSTFKPFMALAALERGFRTASSTLRDPGYFDFGSRRFMDDKIGGHGMVDMYKSIAESCNTYYYMLGSEMGIDIISEFMGRFGFGSRTGIDLDGERTGVLPSREWKAGAFKKAEAQRWYSGETISVAIGQGYNNYTPLQLAHATAVLASGGMNATPRLVRAFQNPVSGQVTEKPLEAFKQLNLQQRHVDSVKLGMRGAVLEGTARGVFKDVSYEVAGKTGTAQVFGLKQGETYKDRAASAERLRDHGWFIAFSPMEQPRIALAAIVENGGFGSQSAAPAIKKVLDTYWQIEAENDPSIALPTPQVPEQTANPTSSRESRP
ncbi:MULTISPECIES: penicillin-binding protein 2 [unclassified Limnobacter]|jgi:penicillin-binding protein 2|uniref:penicillin-binding protein 2 n=1 Tax=unclassified Limnobacter TaxID=2630203 RepID=UPI000156C0DF|nr:MULTISPECIES: penicillin-binding protein 2 [unclassified Limnobacter]EDM84427.1 penicillin-binding protein, transpeptidase [Limnobacter sp. MED105]